MPTVTSNDGVTLAYREQGAGRPLVMLHGWPFSGRFFDTVVPALADSARVLTVDLRGFGDSGKPGHGQRIGRLGADLHDLLEALDLSEVTVLGWSLGCAVAWSHLELFGNGRIAQAVFCCQAPSQYRLADWTLGHEEVFDDAALSRVIGRMETDPAAFDAHQLGTIVAGDLDDGLRATLLAEMAKAPVEARAATMTDHTRQDWRDLLPTLSLPTLVCVADQDEAFPPDGVAEVARLVPGAELEHFTESGHAIFLDEPDHFVARVSAFVQ